jgi:hypothetical protein
MLDTEFWKLLDQRLVVYAQFVEENSKKVYPSPTTYSKTEPQLYEEKLDKFLYMMSVFGRLYSTLNSS